jgi:cell division septation protein DedD
MKRRYIIIRAMEKNANSQLELFTQGQESGSFKGSGAHKLFGLRGYERTILVVIAFAVVNIISFCLGVERGKRLSQVTDGNIRLEVAAVKTTPPTLNTAQRKQEMPVAVRAQQPNIAEQPKIREYIQAYTIQLASYKAKATAQKEAQSLKNKGLSPLILVKGDYAILCVGSFANKDAAQPLLSQLKKHYQDCYLRRL